MEKRGTLLVLLLAGKVSNATGYSGVNNDLLVIYAILIGLCVFVVGVPKAYKMRKNRKNKQHDSSVTT